MSKKRIFPMTLKLKDGLEWTGKIRVEAPGDGKYLVCFDAQDANGTFIYDRHLFTRELILDWTGVDIAVPGDSNYV